MKNFTLLTFFLFLWSFDTNLCVFGNLSELKIVIQSLGDEYGHSVAMIGQENGHYSAYEYRSNGPPIKRIVNPNKKAETMKMPAKVQRFNVANTDKIFYEMVANEGWNKKNYSSMTMRTSRAFTYEFVNHLYGGECPRMAEWPDNFQQAEIDKEDNVKSVFSKAYAQMRNNFKNSGQTSNSNPNDCHLEDFELKMTVEIRGVKPEMLPPIVQITSGQRRFVNGPEEFMKTAFTLQEWAHPMEEQKDGNGYKARFKVFNCNGHSFFHNLFILDKSMNWKFHEVEEGNLRNFKDSNLYLYQKPERNIQQ